MVRLRKYNEYHIDDFRGGIVSNLAGGSNYQLNKIAEDILNFIPNRQGELKKIPIGMYLTQFVNNIAKVIYFPAPTGDEILISTVDGKLWKLGYNSATELTFPSQDYILGDSAYYTQQPTVITDYFVFGGKLFLLTGTKVNYVYANGEIRCWGQRGILPPVEVTDVELWQANTIASVNDYCITTNTDVAMVFKCTSGGTTGSTEPTWSKTSAVTDNTVTWEYVTDVAVLNRTQADVIKEETQEQVIVPVKIEPLPEKRRAVIDIGGGGGSNGSGSSGSSGDTTISPVVHPFSPTTIPNIIGQINTNVNTVSAGDVRSTASGFSDSGVASSPLEKNAVNYVYTFWNGHAESNPSPESGNWIVSEYGVVRVKIEIGDTDATEIRLYRYERDTGNYRFVESISDFTANSTYYYIDTIHTNKTAEPVDYFNYPPPPCRIGVVYSNYVFLAGDYRNGRQSRLYFSKLAEPEAYNPNDFIEVGQDDGEKIVALVPLKSSLVIFKEHSMYLLVGTNKDSFEMRFVAPIGCVSESGVIAVEDTIFCISETGIYATNGMQYKKISDNIDNYFNDENVLSMRQATALYEPNMKAIYFNMRKTWLSDSTTFIYHLDKQIWTRTTMGITDGVTAKDKAYFSLGKTLYFVSDTPYASLYGHIITKWLPLVDTADRTIVRRISVTSGGVEAGTSMNIYYRTDYEDTWHLLKTLTFSASKQTFMFDTNISGNYFQFKFTHNGEMNYFMGATLFYRPKGKINKE